MLLLASMLVFGLKRGFRPNTNISMLIFYISITPILMSHYSNICPLASAQMTVTEVSKEPVLAFIIWFEKLFIKNELSFTTINYHFT